MPSSRRFQSCTAMACPPGSDSRYPYTRSELSRRWRRYRSFGEATDSWPGGLGRATAQGSHRSVRARIRAYGSSGPVSRQTTAGRSEHLDGHGDPGDRAAGLDCPAVVRVALRLFAGREAAVVVAVESGNGSPQPLGRRAVVRVSGDAVEFAQAPTSIGPRRPRPRGGGRARRRKRHVGEVDHTDGSPRLTDVPVLQRAPVFRQRHQDFELKGFRVVGTRRRSSRARPSLTVGRPGRK